MSPLARFSGLVANLDSAIRPGATVREESAFRLASRNHLGTPCGAFVYRNHHKRPYRSEIIWFRNGLVPRRVSYP